MKSPKRAVISNFEKPFHPRCAPTMVGRAAGKNLDLKRPERRFPMNFRPRLRHMATVKLRETATFDFMTFASRPQLHYIPGSDAQAPSPTQPRRARPRPAAFRGSGWSHAETDVPLSAHSATLHRRVPARVPAVRPLTAAARARARGRSGRRVRPRHHGENAAHGPCTSTLVSERLITWMLKLREKATFENTTCQTRPARDGNQRKHTVRWAVRGLMMRDALRHTAQHMQQGAPSRTCGPRTRPVWPAWRRPRC